MKQFQNHFFLHSSIRCEKNTCYLALKLCCNCKLLSPFPPLQWTAITFLGSLSSHSLTLCVKYNNWLKQRIKQTHPQVRSLGYYTKKLKLFCHCCHLAPYHKVTNLTISKNSLKVPKHEKGISNGTLQSLMGL